MPSYEYTISKWAEKQVAQIWDIIMVTMGGSEDNSGIDGYLFKDEDNPNLTVQVKFDKRIYETRNIYDEIKSKPKWKPNQEWWDDSPHNSMYYIFVTRDEPRGNAFAILLNLETLLKAREGKEILQINPTSIGYLIPLSEIEQDIIDREKFDYPWNY